jgi:hypothetical protein
VGGVRQHDLEISSLIDGWVKCENCGKWREHGKNEENGVSMLDEDDFVCSMVANFTQGCDTPEDTTWTSVFAFLNEGDSTKLDEKEMLKNGYVENAVEFLVYKLEDAERFKTKDGSTQKSIAQKFHDWTDKLRCYEDAEALIRGYDSATDKNEYEAYVKELTNLMSQLESEIEEKYKHEYEIGEWRAKFPGVSCICTVADLYGLGWALEEAIRWPKSSKRKRKDLDEEEENEDEDYSERERRRKRKGGRGDNRKTEAAQHSQQEKDRRPAAEEASARVVRDEERETAAGAEGGGAKMIGDVIGMTDHPESKCETDVDHSMTECERSKKEQLKTAVKKKDKHKTSTLGMAEEALANKIPLHLSKKSASNGSEKDCSSSVGMSEEEGGHGERREVGGGCGGEGGGGKGRGRADQNDVRKGDGKETEEDFESLPLHEGKNKDNHVSKTQVYFTQYYDRELKCACLMHEVPNYFLSLMEC